MKTNELNSCDSAGSWPGRKIACVRLRALVGAAAVPLWSGPEVAAQNAPIPRAPDGHPELQRLWDSATATPLERPAQFEGRQFMTAQEAADFEATVRTRVIDALN